MTCRWICQREIPSCMQHFRLACVWRNTNSFRYEITKTKFLCAFEMIKSVAEWFEDVLMVLRSGWEVEMERREKELKREMTATLTCAGVNLRLEQSTDFLSPIGVNSANYLFHSLRFCIPFDFEGIGSARQLQCNTFPLNAPWNRFSSQLAGNPFCSYKASTSAFR